MSMIGKHHSLGARKKISEAGKGRFPWNKGKHLSEITKQKLSEAHKGKHHSEATKQKLSKLNIGENNSMYGKHHSPETCKKMSKSRMGHSVSEMTRKRLAKTQRGKVLSKETCKKIAESHKGLYHSEATRRNMSEAQQGNKSWRYIDGRSKINDYERNVAMHSVEYKLWREKIFRRDDYTCQICKVRGGKLQADHIKRWRDYPELRYVLDNGRVLCVDCHRKTPTYGYQEIRND